MDMITGAFGGGDEEEERNEDGELVSVVEARKEAEAKRREKHEQMEAEREEIRAGIRKKYGIKKKDPDFMESSSQIGRKKKTPEELAAEARGEGGGDGGGVAFPTNLTDVTAKISGGPQALVSGVQEKCSLM